MVKHSPYAGVLATPIKSCVHPTLGSGRVPRWFVFQGGRAEQWPLLVAADRANGKLQFIRRVIAVYEHFDITLGQPFAELDLALSLAQIHEPDLFEAAEPKLLARLFTRYKIDSGSKNAELHLSLAIASKHVPGFMTEWPELRKRGRLVHQGVEGRWASMPIVDFIVIVGRIWDYHEKNGAPRPLPRKTAEFFVSPTQLHKISPGIARLARRFRAHYGNAGNSLSVHAIEGYIRQMDNARKDLAAGKASGFQMQFVFEAFDLIEDWNIDEDRREAHCP